ncbi:type VI secretion system protein TssL, long form [Methylomarinum sp. Ch1-1]|uniref:Type VI secretion system protein TssL, long form n=1 Tax=Methylomarinum roseum TaxID=3067653 RepID=A0AAU7NQT5_9GAMM
MAEKKCPPTGAPPWMATFADMVTLLMAFFVLLLSFSSMDVKHFKEMAQSIQDAFGVQKVVKVTEVPMGTSIIAQHFSPAVTEPTPLAEVKQSVAQNLDTETPQDRDARLKDLRLQVDELKKLIVEAKRQEIEDAAEQIRKALAEEIESGLVTVETRDLDIIIRINETGSFSSGSAELKAGFSPVMKKISASIKRLSGKILVGGHTDDIPIETDYYRSNWELSASRAVTVAHHLLQDPLIDPVRVEVEGHADTQPLAPNNTAANRAKNRRVEIILAQDIE